MDAAAARWTPFRQVYNPAAGAPVRLLCLPFAGGNATSYHAWIRELAPAIEAWPIELPGRGTRLDEPLVTERLDLIDRLATALESHLTEPFALYGHSMGAKIAFDLAREFRRRGRRAPERLFVSGCPAPQLRRNRRTYDLPRDELIRDLRAQNGTAPALLNDDEFMEMLLPIMRADLRISEAYEYREEAPLEVPIVAFAGLDDPVAPPAEVAEWQAMTRASFRLVPLPGGHFFIHTERSRLLEDISSELRALHVSDAGTDAC
jgi:medium-chain acyl-[acyl-carrier-protein] hydrolase